MIEIQKRDMIIRALKFLQLFYELKPKRCEYTIADIRKTISCSRSNARHWVDMAGFVIPIVDIGYDKHHQKKGPPGKTYGLAEGGLYGLQ